MPIRRLSQSLVNKIAAGEVVERPASVVKELMENAVDAGATRIDVSAAAGGSELVRVADNGGGISADELPLAVASHATSKITAADDLFSVRTMGFRGEALASIAEVSRLVLRSRPTQGDGAQIQVDGGRAGEVEPCGCPVGTIVEVRDLFFNTPVRRKFLRSTQTELGHVSEAFTRVALALPEVHFTLQHNDRAVFDLPASGQWIERIARLFGRELAEKLIRVESQDGEVRLSGYVAHPSQSRSNNAMQYLFLNRRHIRDRSLQHALAEAYRGLLLTGRYPIALLRLEMPSELVDVNVHPTKLEVRFQDAGRLYSQLLSTLRTTFLSTDLDTRITAPNGDPSGAHDDARTVQMRRELVDWAKGEMASWKRPGGEGSPPLRQNAFALAPDAGPRPPLELTRLDRAWPAAPGGDFEESPPGAAPSDARPFATPRPAALQVHNRYLVAESDEGVMVIDQHALHERILYEALRKRVESGSLESQALLVPEPVDLLPSEAAAAIEHRELLEQLGLRIEPFGGETVLVAAYPAMLANLQPADVLRTLLDQLRVEGKTLDARDMLDGLLHTIACKAAIKAGDRLAPGEIEALLEQRHLIQQAHHCPHGRPTAVIFTREELDRHFKRT